MIPFFKYYVSKKNNNNFFDKLNDSFRNDETIVIINFIKIK